MTRHGSDIREVAVKDAVETGISYASFYAEWDACLKCGLDLWKWETGEYPRWFKIRVVAFSNIRGLIDMHTEDAKAAKMAKKKR